MTNKFYLDLARQVSTASKDPSTKVGAVIVGLRKEIVSVGFNGFPMGMNDDPALYEDREEKYSRIIHAEMNALLFASRPLEEGCTLYTWPFGPCDRCMVHMLQSGIRKFRCPPGYGPGDRWRESITKGSQYARECLGDYKMVMGIEFKGIEP